MSWFARGSPDFSTETLHLLGNPSVSGKPERLVGHTGQRHRTNVRRAGGGAADPGSALSARPGWTFHVSLILTAFLPEVSQASF